MKIKLTKIQKEKLYCFICLLEDAGLDIFNYEMVDLLKNLKEETDFTEEELYKLYNLLEEWTFEKDYNIFDKNFIPFRQINEICIKISEKFYYSGGGRGGQCHYNIR